MWESRRDFQRVWEGWEAGIMAFHAFHTLSFPWPAFRPAMLNKPICRHPAQCAAPATRRSSYWSFVNECIGDNALIEDPWKIGGLAPVLRINPPSPWIATITDECLGADEAAGSRQNNFRLSRFVLIRA
jgi:hypothetical protein